MSPEYDPEPLYTTVIVFLILIVVILVGVIIWDNRSLFKNRIYLWYELRRILRRTQQLHLCDCLISGDECDTEAQHVLAAILLPLVWRQKPLAALKLRGKAARRSHVEIDTSVIIGALEYFVSHGVLTRSGHPRKSYQLNFPVKQVEEDEVLTLHVLRTTDWETEESVRYD